MAEVWLFVLVCGLLFGVRGAAIGTKRAYTTRRDAWDKKHPKAPWVHRRASMLGCLFALAKDGGPAAVAGWKEGWKQGRAIGEEKAAAWRPDADVTKEKVDVDQPLPVPDPQPAPAPPPGPAPKHAATTGRPSLSVVKNPPGGGGPDPVPSPGGPTVIPAPTTNNAPGGVPIMEVVNAETLLAAMQHKERQAAIEAEDANVALSRAQAQAAYTEQVIAQMSQPHLKFRAEDIAIVVALHDPEAQTIAACQARKAAADHALAAAKGAVAMAAKHVQLQSMGAAGAAYGN